MKKRHDLAQRAKDLTAQEGFNTTCLPGVYIHQATKPIARQPNLYDCWIVALLQGEKTLYQGGRTIRFTPDAVLCVAAGTPVECQADATPENPITSLVLEINTEDLLSMATRITDLTESKAMPPHVLDLVPMTDDIQDVIRRLIDLLHHPTDAAVLGDGIITELTYRVLQNGLARSLIALASNRNTAGILKALRVIQNTYTEDINIETLSRQAGMSVSSFHAHFKKTTSQSPLKYIKSIRLSKAQSLIGSGHQSVSEAAFTVGYNSASQFSREYKQYYGVSPVEHLPEVVGRG